MKNLKELEQKYLELGKEIEALKNQVTEKEEVINCKVGGNNSCWKAHTDTNCYQQLNVCEETGFFDGQLVWCWDNDDTHSRDLKFYDAKNKCTYQFNGKNDGYVYDNYEPFEGNYPDWALEAFQTLKR